MNRTNQGDSEFINTLKNKLKNLNEEKLMLLNDVEM